MWAGIIVMRGLEGIDGFHEKETEQEIRKWRTCKSWLSRARGSTRLRNGKTGTVG